MARERGQEESLGEKEDGRAMGQHPEGRIAPGTELAKMVGAGYALEACSSPARPT
jgi:hypothetical protein